VCRRPLPLLWLAVVLALMAQTSVYGIGLALVLAIASALIYTERLNGAEKHRMVAGKILPAAIVMLVAMTAAVAQLFPGPDPYFVQTWTNISIIERITLTLTTIWQAYIPIPEFGAHYWNTNFLDAAPVLQFLLGLGLLVLALILFARRRAAFFLLASGTGGILVITGFKFAGYMRHYGHLFILLLAAEWIAASGLPRKSAAARDRYRCWFFSALLAFQAVAGLVAGAGDWLFPLSSSREAAQYIAKNYDESIPIVGHLDYCVSSLSGYLSRPIFYPADEAYGTYNTQNQALRRPVNPDSLLAQTIRLMRDKGSKVLLVLSDPLKLPKDDLTLSERTTSGENTPVARVALVKRFERSVMADEAYNLYRVEPIAK
jgi:hypothetical protein